MPKKTTKPVPKSKRKAPKKPKDLKVKEAVKGGAVIRTTQTCLK